MGAADVVPGVSGGTIAFIFGIYEELIYSIKKVSGESLLLFLKGKFVQGIKSIPFSFLIPLALGILTAIFSLASIISHLLETQPEFIWSFFFGLVLASIIIIWPRVKTWDLPDILGLIASTVFAYVLTGLVPGTTPDGLIFFFLSGVIAIIAMILPGISGSFILVLLGKYQQILDAVVDKNFAILIAVTAGCAVGISLFSRVLSWLFAKHHDISMAILIGFMIGSLRKVWPWKEVISTRINSHGEVVPLLEKNILPAMTTETLMVVGMFIFGIVVMMLLNKLQVSKEHLTDIKDSKFTKEHDKAVSAAKKHKI